MSTDPFRDDALLDWQGQGYDISLERRRLGAVNLSSGQVCALDPMDALYADPIELELEAGAYSVVLLSADLRDERKLAYLIIEISGAEALRWEELEPLDTSSGLLALMDADVASLAMDAHNLDEDEFERVLWRECSKNRRQQKLGWTNIPVQQLGAPAAAEKNLVAVEVPAGQYQVWAGRDDSAELALLVVDFGVLDILFTPFGLRY
ncbi:DUF4241 domain-containing protein [Microvenator marinus]|jgi:hypothetical protein|uniref:DUF4241 domain-containing protein n=1 Tax=Microvenator marinus TaxID=2600177 RepID=A0A5B8XQ84_9DELT|nr:DUF4241 domain-containing protein [Microvenator marinus]QED27685.1 DUF4241 domain-containing protein [Microvenator marinus]